MFEQPYGDWLKLSKVKVCVVGLGQIGFPVAEYVSARGLEVWGIDINAVTIENARKTGKFNVTSSWQDVPPVDVYVVCVTTGQRNEAPDLSPVFAVCRKISEKANSSALVWIESTILPGTCKKMFETMFKSKIRLAHVPHRYWALEPEKHGVNQIRVIGGGNTGRQKQG